MVTITKSEARARGIEHSGLCDYHMQYPDQTASMHSCEKCILIREPCGCTEDEGCEDCAPLDFALSNAKNPKIPVNLTYLQIQHIHGLLMWYNCLAPSPDTVKNGDCFQKNERVMAKLCQAVKDYKKKPTQRPCEGNDAALAVG